jgi:hypothetical protein
VLAGCDTGIVKVSRGPIDQSLAETYARVSSGISMAGVDVVGSRLSTYGAEHPGGGLATADTQVWVVTLSGLFPLSSCKIEFPWTSGEVPATPCPTPNVTERVVLDAGDGEVIVVLPGG